LNGCNKRLGYDIAIWNFSISAVIEVKIFDEGALERSFASYIIRSERSRSIADFMLL
jgi:hypothetical protein